MLIKVSGGCLLALALGAQAMAADGFSASVTPQAASKDAILVSHDGRFQPLLGAAVVRKGDRVMALKGGRAALAYSDGCKLNLAPGSMITIGAVSPCAGAGTAFRPVQGDTNGFLGLTTTELVVTTLVLGTAIGVSAGLDSSVDNSPSSP